MVELTEMEARVALATTTDYYVRMMDEGGNVGPFQDLMLSAMRKLATASNIPEGGLAIFIREKREQYGIKGLR